MEENMKGNGIKANPMATGLKLTLMENEKQGFGEKESS